MQDMAPLLPLLDSVKRHLSIVADLMQIAGFFGISATVLTPFVAVIVGVLSDISPATIAGLAILSIAIVLVLMWFIVFRIAMVSLRNGSRMAYEKLRGTMWSEAAERLRVDSSPNGILDYMATALTLHAPIYGKYLPSSRLELIEANHVNSGSIKNGATVLELNDEHRRQVTDLKIKRSALRKSILHMKEGAKSFPANRN